MHAIFMLYGKKEWVDLLIRDMSSQKLLLTYRKEGEKDISVPIECQLRILPFGLYEFVFPKEYADLVLTSLKFHEKPAYDLDKEFKIMGLKIKPLDYAKKFLRIEDAPKDFKTDNKMLWIDHFVSIIPIGVRYDGEVTEPENNFNAGWSHEAI